MFFFLQFTDEDGVEVEDGDGYEDGEEMYQPLPPDDDEPPELGGDIPLPAPAPAQGRRAVRKAAAAAGRAPAPGRRAAGPALAPAAEAAAEALQATIAQLQNRLQQPEVEEDKYVAFGR